MNKKVVNSILIVILIFIWASVFVKIFVKKNPTSDSVFDSGINNTSQYSVYFEKDSFDFKISERDPFNASKKRRVRTVSNTNKNPKPKSTRKQPVNIKWPEIQYFGYVKSDNSTNKLVLLKVDGRLHRKREKERIDQLSIQRAFSDSVIVSINNEKKTILKGNE